jgi:hypothetical protein
MPLLDLVERIATYSDDQALNELHDNRVLFLFRHKKALRLADYVAAIRESSLARQWCGYDDMVLDHAYDLTIDKFCNIPTDSDGRRSSKCQGPDCRYYFGAFLDCATARLKANPPANAIEAEASAAEILRRFVERHFHFSCWESRRKAQKLVRRYMWELGGYTLYIWLPLEIPGRQCREWLNTHVPDVDARRVGEQDRVQEIVDKFLTRREIIPLHRVCGNIGGIPAGPGTLPSFVEERITVEGLAGVVAEEKAENIMHQRPAVRQLGVDKLKELIHAVFAELACGDYVEETIATHFGISKSTLSRFAGSRWGNYLHGPVPDLWRNTAQTLAGHSAFIMAAQRAGVWKRVSQVSTVEANRGRIKDG